MKKTIINVLWTMICLYICFFVYGLIWETNTKIPEDDHNLSEVEESQKEYSFYVKGKEIYSTEDENTPFFLKGVNMGLGKPGAFPGQVAITKEEYTRWFQWIGEMNANTIRVYTVQGPEFYEAFYNYNKTHDNHLYLLQGIWYDETIVEDKYDLLDPDIIKVSFQDIENLTNIFHGNAVIEKKPGHAGGEYKWDISEYVLGWVLGIETDDKMVQITCENHPEVTDYDGTYLYVQNANGVEVFWAMMADHTVAYEMEKYQMQRPISFSNWLTTDILEHPNEPFEKEDSQHINEQALHCKEPFKAGIFATYHVYPYYPDFMYTQPEYINYIDHKGNINTYRAYLEDLIAAYDIPVVVGEFGVPCARGITHENPYNGYNQGHMDEAGQSEAILSMLGDIVETGYAGAIVFTWQDEWFKRTWNTMDYTDSHRRAYWCDVQTNEQHFGILEFVPSITGLDIEIDGKKDEWSKSQIIGENEDFTLSARSDAAYLYLMIESRSIDFDKDVAVIPLDITPNSGSNQYLDYVFPWGADFVITVNGKNNSRVLVQDYYDLYRYDYTKYDSAFENQNNDVASDTHSFSPIYLLVERELYLPQTKETLPLVKFETGKLQYGTTDSSLTDFCFTEGVLELRIPWGLIGFRDPSTKEVQQDFRKYGHGGITIDAIRLGVYTSKANLEFLEYTWDNWENPDYTERRRQIYYDLKEAFGGL